MHNNKLSPSTLYIYIYIYMINFFFYTIFHKTLKKQIYFILFFFSKNLLYLGLDEHIHIHNNTFKKIFEKKSGLINGKSVKKKKKKIYII